MKKGSKLTLRELYVKVLVCLFIFHFWEQVPKIVLMFINLGCSLFLRQSLGMLVCLFIFHFWERVPKIVLMFVNLGCSLFLDN